MHRSAPQRGLSLIEVLVAVLVFSIGLMGVAGWMVVSMRASHAAYLRTQVAFLAQGMVERMQANVLGVWRGDYDGAYPDGSTQDCQAGCTPSQVARRDRGEWSRQLAGFLPPGARATIACSRAGLADAPSSAELAQRPPYGGHCSMSMTWSEQGVGATGSNQNGPAWQTLRWDFQP